MGEQLILEAFKEDHGREMTKEEADFAYGLLLMTEIDMVADHFLLEEGETKTRLKESIDLIKRDVVQLKNYLKEA